MEIRKLDQDNSSGWFEFFDNRAFVDHPDWKTCYCTAPFYPRPAGYPATSSKRRDYAKWLIDTGRMTGYLAYEDNKVVGWCNVNRRKALPKYSVGSKDEDSVLSIACFTVDKDYRRRGVARQLLRRVIRDATESDAHVIEAYPRKRARSAFGQFVGPYAMYEAEGFREETTGGRTVMRYHLKK